ncbi:ATP-binding cassette domain-containing protein [Devriesea agamarum]|uniref:ATP-binding cassette domain-containing protein n=1 Tax=Devriesea agamarum TaxID=472569 RepID=UPI00071D5677|nr:ATP-binding cassette domain-containing protein [Devriesea agamarum]
MTGQHELTAHLEVPSRGLLCDLTVHPGHTLALVGPNGAGKSTVLAVIAGTLNSSLSRITLGGRRLDGVAIHKRRIALLGQDPLLLPHLSLEANVAFAPRCAGLGRGAARAKARDLLESVGIGNLASRRPHEVSGGQAQRAAIARALAAQPDLILLDEPMAALDVDAAPVIRDVLADVLQNQTAIVVTHDVADAIVLADQVAVLEEGHLTDMRATFKVLAQPASRFGALLAGFTVIDAQLRAGEVYDATGTPLPMPSIWHACGDGGAENNWTAENDADHEPRPVQLALAPWKVDIIADADRENGTETQRDEHACVREVCIDRIESRGHMVVVHADGLASEISAAQAAALGLVPGQRVRFGVGPEALCIMPSFPA